MTKNEEKVKKVMVYENKVTQENWVDTPKYKNQAMICNHRENCEFVSCGHATPHEKNQSCKNSCYGAGKCFDVSAIGMWTG